MAVPDYQSFFLPVLKMHQDKNEHSMSDIADRMKEEFALSDDDIKELLPSGKQSYFRNRIGWARTYLSKAGLLASSRRNHTIITERGLDVLKGNPDVLRVKHLRQYSEFIEFHSKKKEETPKISETEEIAEADDSVSPEEMLIGGYKSIRQELASEIIEQMKSCSPEFFERLVVELLVAMGYGGSRKDAGQAVGRSGDEGIDGIIKEDKLGLDVIYIQAKRWENTIGRPEIQKFVGALMGKHAKKGIFLTTSTYTKEANEYALIPESKIILIDGEKLAELMIDHNVGVSVIATYEIKKIDLDYFVDE